MKVSDKKKNRQIHRQTHSFLKKQASIQKGETKTKICSLFLCFLLPVLVEGYSLHHSPLHNVPVGTWLTLRADKLPPLNESCHSSFAPTSHWPSSSLQHNVINKYQEEALRKKGMLKHNAPEIEG